MHRAGVGSTKRTDGNRLTARPRPAPAGEANLRHPAARVRPLIELAVPRTVDKALPLVPVEHQDPPGQVAGHAHQYPVTASPPGAEREGHLDRAVTVTGPRPGERAEIDAKLLRRRFQADRFLHGILATAQ